MRGLVALWSGVIVLAFGLVAGGGSSVAATTQVFEFTGAPQDLVVPAGVTSISVVADGAAGGGTGGLGGRVTTPSLPVAPGEILRIFVGGVGATPEGGFNGGGSGGGGPSPGPGGGGATDIRRAPHTLLDRLIIAGGGGGGGVYTFGGSGAGAASDGASLIAEGGGGGGAGGKGGAGASGGDAGTDGVVGQGGAGGAADGCCISPSGGGGGGGGIGGGGGGGDEGFTDGGAAGGGGSSHGPIGSTFGTAPSGDGRLTVTFDLQPDLLYRTAGDDVFVGDNIYATPDAPAKVGAQTKRNKPVTFDIKIENDNNVPASFLVTGEAATGKFTAAYRDDTDITSQVIGAGYPIGPVPPGSSETITLTITGKKGKESILVTASDGSKSDSVLVKVRIRS